MKGENKLLQFIFIFFILILFFLLTLLIIPYYYQINFYYKDHFHYFLLFKYSFISLKVKGSLSNFELIISLFNHSINLTEIPFLNNIGSLAKDIINNENNTKKEIKSIKKKFDFAEIAKIINQNNLNHLFQFIVKLLNHLKNNLLKIKMDLAFSDPYYSGLFYAYYYSFKNLFKKGVFNADLCWQASEFKGDLEIAGKIILIQMLWIMISFLFSLKTIRLLKQFYKLVKN